MEKIVTTKKEHVCGYCHKIIPVGDKAYYMEGKDPIYELDKEDAIYGTNGDQIGINYWRVWYCHDDTDTMPACSKEEVN